MNPMSVENWFSTSGRIRMAWSSSPCLKVRRIGP